MRKISALAIVLVLFLCSCSAKSDVKPVVKGISFLAKITYYNEKYECDTVISKDGQMTATVRSPESIDGLKLQFSSGRIIAEYMGIKYEPKTDGMPLGNTVRTVYTVLSQIDVENIVKSADSTNCVINGEASGREYELILSPTGLPISLSIVNDDFTVEFCDVTVI